MSVYNLKDIIRINQDIGESGELRDDSSIKFALSIGKNKKSWLFELSYIVRGLLVDHPFVDGNKRTAYLLCTLIIEDNKYQCDDDKIVKNIHLISKKSVNDINKITRMMIGCLVEKD